MREITGGQAVIETLVNSGVEKIFGIPGIHNLAIYDAIYDLGIDHISSRHEQGAGFMALGYARTSGKPGVALVITGPGLGNIATAMGQAFHDSVPMLVISSQVETSALDYRSGYLHEMKNSTFFASSVSKESRCIEHAWQIPGALRDAYRLSVSGRPGPVHVEIPLDILQDVYTHADPVIVETAEKKSVHPADDNAVRDLIKESVNPIILAGGGSAAASAEVRMFSEQLAIPVVSTCAGKGVMDERHPLSLGCRLHFPPVQSMLSESDLVIALGTELSPTDFWERSLTLGKKLLCINTDPGAFYNQRTADIGIKGDVREVLGRYLEMDMELPVAPEERYRRVDDALKDSRAMLSEISGINMELPLILSVLEQVRSVLPPEGIFWTDMATPSYIGISEYQAREPLTFLHPVGFGTLGVALPGAIGSIVSSPERKVCAMAGDGGFQFTLQELAIASELQLPLPVILWNDRGYGEIKRNQSQKSPSRVIAVDHEGIDFQALAKAYHMRGIRLGSVESLGELLAESLESKGPTLIEIDVKECLE